MSGSYTLPTSIWGFRISKTEISDTDLIRLSRTGDRSALETLYARHHEAGLKFARRLMSDKADADDVAQDAFLKVTAAIERGNGPETAFRPYLLRAVRTVAADRWEAQAKETPTDDTGDDPMEDASLAALLNRDNPELVMKAFQSLPVRWMTVLWHAEVEREAPRRIAPILGIEPGAVSALLLRARKGLREAYLTAYAEAPPRTDCEPTFPYLAATVLGTSSARDRRKVKEHTNDCEDCAKVLAQLTDVGATMRGTLAPMLLLPSGAAFSGTQLFPRTGASVNVSVLMAAAVLVVAVSVAATGAAGLGSRPSALPALTAPSAHQLVPAPLPAGTSTAAPLLQDETAAENEVGTVQEYPAELIIPQPVDAGDSAERSVQQIRPGGTAMRRPAQPTLMPMPPATVSSTPSTTSSPTATPAPTAAPSSIRTSAPTTSAPTTSAPTASAPTTTPVPTPTPAPSPTEPPAVPDCTFFLLWCLSG